MDKLVFLISILYFLRLEWMYLKFQIKVLSNLRLKFDISYDVCPYKILLQLNGQSLINMIEAEKCFYLLSFLKLVTDFSII